MQICLTGVAPSSLPSLSNSSGPPAAVTTSAPAALLPLAPLNPSPQAASAPVQPGVSPRPEWIDRARNLRAGKKVLSCFAPVAAEPISTAYGALAQYSNLSALMMQAPRSINSTSAGQAARNAQACNPRTSWRTVAVCQGSKVANAANDAAQAHAAFERRRLAEAAVEAAQVEAERAAAAQAEAIMADPDKAEAARAAAARTEAISADAAKAENAVAAAVDSHSDDDQNLQTESPLTWCPSQASW